MAKDRSRPFSRKHARYWMTAAGGMVIIMVANVILGFTLFDRDEKPKRTPAYQPIPPVPAWAYDAAVDAPADAPSNDLDAGVDAD
ncbi:MAG: hypothetical protein F9K40_15195 [Kofleriaceae bacterium]|nr:MAG: hypothetical protein F9K40_15195 [Kofleriaceae bacterium]MBZ0235332.1 hypothetical protein [Kofleriaceae bacterium]